jgi:molecular chaperone HtpG
LKELIASVTLFDSVNEKVGISLDEYLEKATEKEVEVEKDGKKEKQKQKTIYYIIAKSKSEALSSPYLSQFKEKGYDVLALTDPIDSFLVQGFNEYKNSKLVSITSGDVELEEKTEDDKKIEEKNKKEFKSLFDLTKSIIGEDKIEEVVFNNKLGSALGALKTSKT